MRFNVSFSLSDQIKSILEKSLKSSSVSIVIDGEEVASLTKNSSSASVKLERGEHNIALSSRIEELGMAFTYNSVYTVNVNDDFSAYIDYNAREYKLTISNKDVMSGIEFKCNNAGVKREKTATNPFGEQAHDSLAALNIEGKYLINTFLHIFLLIATCGLWFPVWVHRVTCFTNTLSEFKYRNPATRALLCAFVPFYFVCWGNETAHRIDKMAIYTDVRCDLESAWHLCMFYFAWLMPVIIQIKINQIVRKAAKNKKNEEAQEPTTPNEAETVNA